ncbi:hypothetical protein BDK51DRAFT_32632 [Blyttiomyces helicus]|uniref:Secreted protein n=1 Tax=Blyttiomyces helicus TaxID=388810 RepID=A0A4P9W1H3_9FUNG|nr:hypothetical protein BDK51DRAFT_32632 [Blyttiomyces helicus]|eukprot:RKO85003.1 hypothetical protein BDK51DRAFT_32632 [Blyttiomyces helicus]
MKLTCNLAICLILWCGTLPTIANYADPSDLSVATVSVYAAADIAYRGGIPPTTPVVLVLQNDIIGPVTLNRSCCANTTLMSASGQKYKISMPVNGPEGSSGVLNVIYSSKGAQGHALYIENVIVMNVIVETSVKSSTSFCVE